MRQQCKGGGVSFSILNYLILACLKGALSLIYFGSDSGSETFISVSDPTQSFRSLRIRINSESRSATLVSVPFYFGNCRLRFHKLTDYSWSREQQSANRENMSGECTHLHSSLPSPSGILPVVYINCRRVGFVPNDVF
jgi:hypothetical protein